MIRSPELPGDDDIESRREYFCHLVSHHEPAARDAKNQCTLTPVPSFDEGCRELTACLSTVLKNCCFHVFSNPLKQCFWYISLY